MNCPYCNSEMATGNYAKAHIQFQKRKIKPLDVIEYIAAHDMWRAKHPT